MAIEHQILDLTFKNTSGGSIAQFSVVAYDTTNAFGAVPVGNANAGPICGINQSRGVDSNGALQTSAQSNDPMQIRVLGVSRGLANGVTVVGSPLYAQAISGAGTNAAPYHSHVRPAPTGTPP